MYNFVPVRRPEGETYTIKILTTSTNPDYDKDWSEDNKWVGEYVSFQDHPPYDTLKAAYDDLYKLHRLTGKCYAIYGSMGYVYHDSIYYEHCKEGA